MPGSVLQPYPGYGYPVQPGPGLGPGFAPGYPATLPPVCAPIRTKPVRTSSGSASSGSSRYGVSREPSRQDGEQGALCGAQGLRARCLAECLPACCLLPGIRRGGKYQYSRGGRIDLPLQIGSVSRSVPEPREDFRALRPEAREDPLAPNTLRKMGRVATANLSYSHPANQSRHGSKVRRVMIQVVRSWGAMASSVSPKSPSAHMFLAALPEDARDTCALAQSACGC